MPDQDRRRRDPTTCDRGRAGSGRSSRRSCSARSATWPGSRASTTSRPTTARLPRPGAAGDARPCVNLHGNRRLNHALHIAAIVQLRFDCEAGATTSARSPMGRHPRKPALPQTPHQRRDLPPAHRRRPDRRAGPGRAHGGDYEDQRGRPSPDGRLFDQATTRTPTQLRPPRHSAS